MELELGFAKMLHCQGNLAGWGVCWSCFRSGLPPFPESPTGSITTLHTSTTTHASDFGVVEPRFIFGILHSTDSTHTHTHTHGNGNATSQLRNAIHAH